MHYCTFWDLQHQRALISISVVVFGPQSVASDMRFELFTQNDVKQNSKRQRVINSRYREDYIEPVIYRAIMEWRPFPSPSAFRLSFTSSSHHRERCSSRSSFLGLASLFLATADKNDQWPPPLPPPFPPLLLPGLSGYIFINYGWDFKRLLCALTNILRHPFPITLCGLHFLPPCHYFFLFLRKKPSMNYEICFFFCTTTFSTCQVNTTLHIIQWTVFPL